MGQLSAQLSGTAPPAALLAAMKSCIAATRAWSWPRSGGSARTDFQISVARWLAVFPPPSV